MSPARRLERQARAPGSAGQRGAPRRGVPRCVKRPGAEAGVTMVELVIAAGLMALLMVAVFNLLSNFMSMWDKAENRRALVEEASGVAELCARDLSVLTSGERGDLVCEWVVFDTDLDGVKETAWPRLRMICNAAPGQLRRMRAEPERGSRPGDDETRARPAESEEEMLGADEQGIDDADSEGLVEVLWSIVPMKRSKDPDPRRAEGLILRGERIVGSPEMSFFDDEFFAQRGEPPLDRVHEVSGSLLWFGMQFATQTSILDDGWQLGGALSDCSASWDAWDRARPDIDVHFWNEKGAGMPSVKERALFPRRARLEFEFERSRDRLRRPKLIELLEKDGTALRVSSSRHLPESGTFVRVDAEWMQVTSVTDDSIGVKRAARGTQARPHDVGAMIHFGTRFVREVPISAHEQDWNL